MLYRATLPGLLKGRQQSKDFLVFGQLIYGASTIENLLPFAGPLAVPVQMRVIREDPAYARAAALKSGLCKHCTRIPLKPCSTVKVTVLDKHLGRPHKFKKK